VITDLVTFKRVEARDLIRRKERLIGKVLFKTNSLIVVTIIEKLVKKFKCCEHVVLLQEKVNNAIAK
jgi:hypothetical protein